MVIMADAKVIIRAKIRIMMAVSPYFFTSLSINSLPEKAPTKATTKKLMAYVAGICPLVRYSMAAAEAVSKMSEAFVALDT